MCVLVFFLPPGYYSLALYLPQNNFQFLFWLVSFSDYQQLALVVKLVSAEKNEMSHDY